MDATKEVISKKAIELFQRDGFDNVAIQTICDECGVTRNAFYYHYKNKQDLLMDYCEQMVEGDSDLFREMMTLPTDWDRFWFMCEYNLKLMMEMGRELTRQYLSANLQTMDGFIANNKLSQDWCIPLLSNCQKNGTIGNPMEPAELDKYCIRMLLGFMLSWSLDEDFTDLIPACKTALETFLQVREN